ncbi:acyl-CoA-binding domain-containing protein 5-like isoform X2 [Wolffia australiana]
MDLRDEIFFTLLLALLTTFLFKKLTFVSSASSGSEQDIVETYKGLEEDSAVEISQFSDVHHAEIRGLKIVETEEVGSAVCEEGWEGVEKSELAKFFTEATEFVGSDVGKEMVRELNADLQVQLLGLRRIALEGPCYESSSPMALKASSRAEWHAWQKLGRMNLEKAMEKYVSIISDNIPNWRTLGDEEAQVVI